MASWIKIFRELLQWEWFEKAEMVQIFIYLLLKASCTDKQWQGIAVKRGQLVTSSATIRQDLRLSEQKIRTCIKRLISTGEITYKSTNRYVIITICNYDKYQETGNSINEQNNEQTTSNQRTNNEQSTNKNQKINEQNNEQRSRLISNDTAGYKDERIGVNEQSNEQSTSSHSENNAKINDILRIKKEEYNNNSNQRLESGQSPLPASSDEETASKQDKPKTEKLPFKEIKEMWNETCPGFPKLFTISENRKNKIRLRIAEMGGSEKALPLLKRIFTKMQESNFLKGDNKRGWKASFDWLFENDKNWVKVYEGNYDNKPEQLTATRYTNNRNCNDEWK